MLLRPFFSTPFESKISTWILLVCATFLLTGCATETFAPETAPEYVVIRDGSPFYSLGPQEARGPTSWLRVQTRVKLLRREMGYSLVQLETLKTGYVANENMAIAPPRLPEAANVSQKSHKRGGGNRVDDSDSSLDDMPPPDSHVTTPDLNISPELVPDIIPVPEETQTGPPTFRY